MPPAVRISAQGSGESPDRSRRKRSLIRVSLRVPDRYVARARHVVSVFAQQWGIPVHVSLDGSAGGADIRYGPSDSRDGERAALEIPFDPRVYEPSCRCALLSDAGVQVWGPEDSDPGSVDLIGSCHRLLTFLDEQQVDPAARDRRGGFPSGALPAARRDTTAVPLVDDQAALILQRLERARPGLSASAMPKWPDGKRYAIAITHDTDAVSLGAPRELATNAAKLVVHRDPTFA